MSSLKRSKSVASQALIHTIPFIEHDRILLRTKSACTSSLNICVSTISESSSPYSVDETEQPQEQDIEKLFLETKKEHTK